MIAVSDLVEKLNQFVNEDFYALTSSLPDEEVEFDSTTWVFIKVVEPFVDEDGVTRRSRSLGLGWRLGEDPADNPPLTTNQRLVMARRLVAGAQQLISAKAFEEITDTGETT